MTLIVPTIKIVQNSVTMYGFALKTNYLYEHFDVSRRIDNKEEGYQRSFSKKKINDIKRYLNENNWFIPNAIIVSLEDSKYQIHDDGNIELLDFPSLGLIIDWQHRVKWAYEAGTNIDLFVIWVEWLWITDQAKLFIKINSTQKWVPVSLYLDLLELTEGQIDDFDNEDVPADRRAIEIASKLNEDSDSALNGKIRMTWDPWIGISLSEFVSKSKDYVNPKWGHFEEYWFEEQYNIFKIYFNSIQVVFQDEWENPNSLILKTVWFWGLLKALKDIFAITTRNHPDFSTESVTAVLNLINDLKFDKSIFPGWWITAQDAAGNTIISKIKQRLTEEHIPRVRIW